MTTLLYVSSFFAGADAGISRFRWDPSDGALDLLETTPGTDALYLAPSPDGRSLYAANCNVETEGRPGGGLLAFAIAPEDGALSPLNAVNGEGTIPVYLALSPDGRFAVMANCGSPEDVDMPRWDGNAVVFPIRADGRVGSAAHVLRHEGSSVDPEQQGWPHPHSAVFSQDGRWLYIPDRGIDRIMIYAFDAETGAVSLADPPHVELEPGSGPRHLVLHPRLPWAWVINELANTITAFSVDRGSGALGTLQTMAAMPPGFSEPSNTADLQLHPNGRILYGSNRGHESIAAFGIDGATGKLEPLGHLSTACGGAATPPHRTVFPRSFAISPDGRFMVVGNEGNGTLLVVSIDPEMGTFGEIQHVLGTPKPGFLLFHERGSRG